MKSAIEKGDYMQAGRKNICIDSENILKLNATIIAVVSVIFSFINLLDRNYLLMGIVLTLGVADVIFTLTMKRRFSFSVRAVINSVLQTLIIFIGSLYGSALHEMFPLFLASFAILLIYFRKRVIVVPGAILDVLLIICLVFFREQAFSGAPADLLIKGVCAVNIGMIFCYLVADWGRDFFDEAQVKTSESIALLNTVQEQMNEASAVAEKKIRILEQVRTAADRVNQSSGYMLEVSGQLNRGAEEQALAIDNLTKSIDNVEEQIAVSAAAADEANRITMQAGRKLELGNAEMKEMLSAMTDISEISKEIEQIIQTIDGIAFQTNILALNAAVEAARAGEVGKGFSVVADEVRNLASKCAEAASSTSELIARSAEAVERGMAIAGGTAATLTEILETAQDSSRHSTSAAEKVAEQKELINQISDNLDLISSVVRNNSKIAEESARVARDFAVQSEAMNQIVHSEDESEENQEPEIHEEKEETAVPEETAALPEEV